MKVGQQPDDATVNERLERRFVVAWLAIHDEGLFVMSSLQSPYLSDPAACNHVDRW